MTVAMGGIFQPTDRVFQLAHRILLTSSLTPSFSLHWAERLVVGPLVMLSQMCQPSGEVGEFLVGTVWTGEFGLDPVGVSEVGNDVGPADEEGGVGATEVAQLGRMLAGCVNHHLGVFIS